MQLLIVLSGPADAAALPSFRDQGSATVWLARDHAVTALPAVSSLNALRRAGNLAPDQALLVSHWEVYSDATVKLITTATREMARDPMVGRAEALEVSADRQELAARRVDPGVAGTTDTGPF